MIDIFFDVNATRHTLELVNINNDIQVLRKHDGPAFIEQAHHRLSYINRSANSNSTANNAHLAIDWCAIRAGSQEEWYHLYSPRYNKNVFLDFLSFQNIRRRK